MTSKKAPKRRKLRNSEYYDMQKVFDKLYADSKTGKVFTNLLSVIMSEENIRLAYRNLKTNHACLLSWSLVSSAGIADNYYGQGFISILFGV